MPSHAGVFHTRQPFAHDIMENEPPIKQWNVAASELSLGDLSPFTTSEDGGYSPWTTHTFYWSPGLAQDAFSQPYGSLGYPLTQNGCESGAMNSDKSWPATHVSPQPFIDPESIPHSSNSYFFAPRAQPPSIVNSVHPVPRDGEELKDRSARDEAYERRRERRRAQNRAAQRAFRARKEETIRESSVCVEALRDELTQLQSTNGDLSATVDMLRSQIQALERQILELQRHRTSDFDWDSFDMSMVEALATSGPGPRPGLPEDFSHDSSDSGVFDMSSPSPKASRRTQEELRTKTVVVGVALAILKSQDPSAARLCL